MSIPKRFYLSWPTASVMGSDHEFADISFKALRRLNPDWSVEVLVDEQIEEELKVILDSSDYVALSSRHIVEKIDTWRLLKLFVEGGVYVDADRVHDTPLSAVIEPNTKWLLPTCRDYDFAHDFMASAPGNPAMLNALKLNIQRRKEGHKSTYFLGAQTFMHACTATILGRPLDVNPGEEAFVEIRSAMSEMGFISTFREDPPMCTCTFRNAGGLSKERYESLKKDFYRSYGIGHWTGVW